MSSQSGSKNDEPGLFDDLPLQDQQKSRTPEKGSEPVRTERIRSKPEAPPPTSKSSREEETLALFESIEPKAAPPRSRPVPSTPKPTASTQVTPPEPKKTSRRPETETRPVWNPTVTIGKRIVAGVIDMMAIVVVLIGVALGLRFLGVSIDKSTLPPLLLFVLSFSFLYYVFPLAFWGRTPGMARTDIVTKSRDGQTLSFSQAARRWLGTLLTLATLGIPLLFAGKSGDLPADRLSRSQTFPAK